MRKFIASIFVFFVCFFGGYAAVAALAGCAAIQAIQENPELLSRELRLAAGELRDIGLILDDPEKADSLELAALYLEDAAAAIEAGRPSQGAVAGAREIIRIILNTDPGEDAKVALVLADAILRRVQAYSTPPISD